MEPEIFEKNMLDKYSDQLNIIDLSDTSQIHNTVLKLVKCKVRLTESRGTALIYQNGELVGLFLSRPDYSNGTNIFKVIDTRGVYIEGIKPKFIWTLPELPRKLQWKVQGDPENFWSFEVSVRDKTPELTQIYRTPTPINATEIVDGEEFVAFSKGPMLFGTSIFSKDDPKNPILNLSDKRILLPTNEISADVIRPLLKPEIILTIMGYALFYSKEFR